MTLIPFDSLFMLTGATLRRVLGILRCEQYGDHQFEIFDGCRRRIEQEWNSGTPTKVESKFDSYLSAPAAYLIDSMGFGNLPPVLASALAQNQSPRFAH